MSNNLVLAQAGSLAKALDVAGDGRELVEVLKQTAFKGQVTDSQMTALLVVANQYALNPWTKEIYAFPDKNNGIVPVVGVDGWSRIINSHPQFDGIEFEQDTQSCTCIIYRKDRQRSIKVTEWMDECKRSTGPWQSHPRRMLRHKAMIQCARLAFGFVGIYEQDEAERIVEATAAPAVTVIDLTPKAYPEADFASNFPKWQTAIESGRRSPADIINMVETKGTLTEAQKAAIYDLQPIEAEYTEQAQ